MTRRLIGMLLLIIGLFILIGAIFNPHVRWSSDVGEMDNWIFWGLFTVPIIIGLGLLLGKSLRKLFR